MSLDKLRSRIIGKDTTTDITSLFYLAKEMGCLSEVIGRCYEGWIEIDGVKRRFSFRQKPMTIAQMNLLMKELNNHLKREQKDMRRGMPRKR